MSNFKMRTGRKYIDCSDFPNELGCTLLISGSAKEVFKVALRHAVEEHGHQDTYELRKHIKLMMKDEIKSNTKIKKKGKSK
jgi:predicted small metal-binding protein